MEPVDHLQKLVEHRIAQRDRQIQRGIAAVVAAEVEADADAEYLDSAWRRVPLDHLAQLLIEIVVVVGQRGGAVHRAAVGDDEQQPALTFFAALQGIETVAGPVDRFAVYAFAGDVGLEQRDNVAPGAPPWPFGGIENQMAALVDPSG